MNFSFTEEQNMFQQSVHELLHAKVTSTYLRTLWDADTGRDSVLWQEFADLALLGMCAPESSGGLGLRMVDFVLLAEECGKVALAEPLTDTVLVAAPLLVTMGETGADILTQLIAGKTRVSVGNLYDTLVDDAHVAQWALLPSNAGSELHLLPLKQVKRTAEQSIDSSRHLFSLDWKPTAKTCVSKDAGDWWRAAHNRGALGAAAQLLGVAQSMLDMSVAYTSGRQQFGKPIASFQAVKHMLADVAIALECARPAVYRAAATLDTDPLNQIAVAHAKIGASQAALLAGKNCLQAHGAMGYTWEADLHIWMKRAWVLDKHWGDCGVHKGHVHDYLVNTPDDTFDAEHGLLL